MSQSLRQIKNRIRSIENAKKVTSALEMISVSKLNRIDKLLIASRPYFTSMEFLVRSISASSKFTSHPLAVKKNNKEICLCLITSDSGLCGMYNNSVIRAARDFISKNSDKNIKLVVIGKRGFSFFKSHKLEMLNTYLGANGNYSQGFSDEISKYLMDNFLNNNFSEIFVAYTHFETALIQRALVEKLLPVEQLVVNSVDYIFEPNVEGVLEKLMPEYVRMNLRKIILESFTSEHASRTLSMKAATDNAKELLDGLVLLRNKVRQAGITQEMMEIISASEALKG
ncbi:MAG: ATP synthase F1 subunit gamma [Candidatus Omnitrophica bacterium]|nr:ATP synthase F1 subunit gamma [Candidatus Omnitrophota bacterium]